MDDLAHNILSSADFFHYKVIFQAVK